jgi:hypothetical protein
LIEFVDDQHRVDEIATRRRHHFGWIGLGIVTFIVFELTADPALTVALGCLKFGWDELATARWLRKNDPDRRRGRIASRFYAAWALWRVSGVAVAMMMVAIFVLGPV